MTLPRGAKSTRLTPPRTQGKHALLKAITSVLLRASSLPPPPSAALGPWQEILQQVMVRAEAMALKPKHLPVAFPLMAAVLAALPRETFDARASA